MEQADWDALKAQMDSTWGVMKLQCDQYEVTLVQETSSKSKSWSTVVYVDGHFKGIWISADEDGRPKYEEARRFMRKVSKSLHTSRAIELTRKVLGKREAEKWAAEKHIYFDPRWKSFSSLKKHLLANNACIKRLS